MTQAETRLVLSNDEDGFQMRKSTRKLAEAVAHEGVALTIYGHDHEQWPTLKHAPEFYN